MGRFFVYKEYGAQYERMVQAVASANDDNPNWPAYRKGLEALASILGSMRDQDIQPKRAAALEDLLIKVWSCPLLQGVWLISSSLSKESVGTQFCFPSFSSTFQLKTVRIRIWRSRVPCCGYKKLHPRLTKQPAMQK